MATSTILEPVIIRDSKTVEALLEALEASSHDPERNIFEPHIPILKDKKDLQEFLAKRGKIGE